MDNPAAWRSSRQIQQGTTDVSAIALSSINADLASLPGHYRQPSLRKIGNATTARQSKCRMSLSGKTCYYPLSQTFPLNWHSDIERRHWVT